MSYLVSVPGSDVRVDLDYFLEWRPQLWRKAFLYAIGGELGLNTLVGKRVLEVGCRYGRMATLFGILGACVVAVDVDREAIERARAEVRKHNVEQRVKILRIAGNVRELDEPPFDIIFTKSVLYFCKSLDTMLGQFHSMLRCNGRGVFVENYLGSDLEANLRFRLLHRQFMRSAGDYTGIRKAQLPIFEKWFAEVQFKSFWRLSCAITGRAKNLNA